MKKLGNAVHITWQRRAHKVYKKHSSTGNYEETHISVAVAVRGSFLPEIKNVPKAKSATIHSTHPLIRPYVRTFTVEMTNNPFFYFFLPSFSDFSSRFHSSRSEFRLTLHFKSRLSETKNNIFQWDLSSVIPYSFFSVSSFFPELNKIFKSSSTHTLRTFYVKK